MDEVYCLVVLADGRLAGGGKDGKIKLWPKDGAGEPIVLTHGSFIEAPAPLADGRLVSGGNDGKIRLWPKDGNDEPMILSHAARVRSGLWWCWRTGGWPAAATMAKSSSGSSTKRNC